MSAEIKLLENDIEINTAIALAEKVFMEYEAPIYTKEGVENFRDFLYGEEMKKRRATEKIILWGAYEDGKMVGMCGIRDFGHVTLMFVEGEYHRRGIGRMLMGEACRYAREKYGMKNITLNASPYGLPFYKKIGFIPTDMERIEEGIIYTPMIKTMKE